MNSQDDLTDPEVLTKRVRQALEQVMRCSTCGKLRTRRPTGYSKEELPGGMSYLSPTGVEPFDPEIHCSGHNDVQSSEK